MFRVLHRLALRTRVALITLTTCAVVCGLLGGWYVRTSEETYTRAAAEQNIGFAQQAAETLMRLLAPDDRAALPTRANGMTYVAFYNPDGTVSDVAGEVSPAMARHIAADVRAAAATGTPHVSIQRADGSVAHRLSVRDGSGTVQISVVPAGGGAVVTAVNVEWATDALRRMALVTLGGLLAGTLALTALLAFAIGRFVTRPVERLAETDALTGVANQRAFSVAIAAAIDESRTTGRPLSLIAIDVDGLKQVNDLQGHLAGDRLITDVATAARGAVRAGDLLARVGGDEFVVLCPGLNRRGATEIAGRIEAALEADDLRASLGVAELPHGGSAIDLREQADAALYVAKARRKALRLA
ncbi:MAG TPA: GGDEF domain-containing protein [Solirubrobacteraceae bacterium]|nr:GGDEF domain-containing protein [Solirubrobacteraceae bacterium]